MTRQPISKERVAEIWTNRHKHGMAECQTKGFRHSNDNNFMIFSDLNREIFLKSTVAPEEGRGHRSHEHFIIQPSGPNSGRLSSLLRQFG